MEGYVVASVNGLRAYTTIRRRRRYDTEDDMFGREFSQGTVIVHRETCAFSSVLGPTAVRKGPYAGDVLKEMYLTR